MDPLDLCSLAVKVAQRLGATQAEAVALFERSASLSIERDGITGISEGFSSGLAVRAFVGKSMGISTSTPASESEVEKVVSNAISLARSSPPDNGFKSLPEPKPTPEVPGLFDPELEALTSEELIGFCVDGVEASKSEGTVDVSGGATVSAQEYVVANSLGVTLKTKRTWLGFFIEALAKDGGEVSTGFDYFLVRNLKERNFEKVGKEAAKKALKALGAKKLPSGNYSLVLDERTSLSTISSIVGFGANAYNVMLGSSYYIGKVGSPVASEVLTVKDEPLYPNGIGSSPFDSEGYPCSTLTLLENGVLMSYFTDSYTAGVLGLPNTGRAMRGDLGSRPRPGLTNIQIGQGEISEEELFGDVRLGIFVYDSQIGPVGGSNVSSLIDHGFLIEEGELRYPVKESMVGSTVFDLLQSVDGASKEVLNESGQISPKVRIRNVRVASGG